LRTLYEAGIENAVKEMNKLEIKIFGSSSTRWKGSGTFQSLGETTIYYSADNNNQYGVAYSCNQRC